MLIFRCVSSSYALFLSLSSLFFEQKRFRACLNFWASAWPATKSCLSCERLKSFAKQVGWTRSGLYSPPTATFIFFLSQRRGLGGWREASRSRLRHPQASRRREVINNGHRGWQAVDHVEKALERLGSRLPRRSEASDPRAPS